MEINYNIPKLEKIIGGLSTLTGIAINFCDTDGKTIIRTTHNEDFCSAIQSIDGNLQKCRLSDNDIFAKCQKSQQLEYHVCHAGLCDLAMPIFKNELLVGYVIMGRMRISQSPQESFYTSNRLKKLYSERPLLSYEKIDCLKELLPQILFENAIDISYDDCSTQISKYIKTHLQDKLTIACICDKFHLSKNVLYDAFHNSFNCTVNEYISAQRLKKAKQLLLESNEPVYHIAELVGIENYTYFCKLFKRKEGCTPLEYKRLQTSKKTSRT
jgi:YesN/AraC family two-component response regulator